MTFLILLTAGTFRLGDQIHPITSTEDLMMNRFDTLRYDEQVDRLIHTHIYQQTERDRERERRTSGESVEEHSSSSERANDQRADVHHVVDSWSVVSAHTHTHALSLSLSLSHTHTSRLAFHTLLRD